MPRLFCWLSAHYMLFTTYLLSGQELGYRTLRWADAWWSFSNCLIIFILKHGDFRSVKSPLAGICLPSCTYAICRPFLCWNAIYWIVIGDLSGTYCGFYYDRFIVICLFNWKNSFGSAPFAERLLRFLAIPC